MEIFDFGPNGWSPVAGGETRRVASCANQGVISRNITASAMLKNVCALAI
jgi:hypothetical protein